MMVVHRDIDCRSCVSYTLCKRVETEYAGALQAAQGNWRAIYAPGGGRVGTPIRRCTRAMLRLHADLFRDRHVLEIGCGPESDLDERFCREHRVRYLGIDPTRPPVFDLPWLPFRAFQHRLFGRFVRFGLCRQTRWRRHMVAAFPSPRLRGRTFDVVYGSNSIEHWHQTIEDRETAIAAYQDDVRECRRLLRPGGVMMMNAPMFVHGNPLFIRGDVKAVEAMFDDEWSSVVFEHWREDHGDLLPYCPEKRREAFRERYGIELTNIWILNIVATR